MNIQTSNKLVHLQYEYNELLEQTQMLQKQVEPLQVQLGQLNSYISVNHGDRCVMTQLRETQRRLNALVNQINRNRQRISNLEMRISQESARIQMQQQKQANTMQRQMMRQQASMMKRMQRESMKSGYR